MLVRVRDELGVMLVRLRFWIYQLLTYPISRDLIHIRVFRFGIPLVMKRSQFTTSSEADALRYLHGTGLDLPIPRLIDSLNIGGHNYTIMTRLPGDTMLNLARRGAISDEEVQAVIPEVLAVIRKLWTLSPPPALQGLVMCHPGGHGLPYAIEEMENTIGPLPLSELYAHFTFRLADKNNWTGEDISRLEPERMGKVLGDSIVYVHCDLRPLNVLVHKGKFSGIIDWENSGWHVRHWQLLVLRTPLGLTNPERLSKWWRDVKFEDDIEDAYQAGWELVLHRV